MFPTANVRPCFSLDNRADPGFEVRRLILLTRLKEAPKGMTMPQIANYCSKVSGWNVPEKASSEAVQEVLQSLIDDKLVALGRRFGVTIKGLGYLGDPLKWRIDERTTEELADNLLWKEIHGVFDKAYHKLRPKN